MCVFSQPVESVSRTRIFVRASAPGRQLLAYAMQYRAAGELAMILPLPVPPGCGEDAVRFIDLSGHASFFADLARFVRLRTAERHRSGVNRGMIPGATVV